jgi:hypothetical protein
VEPLRADDFETFMAQRQRLLMALISSATLHPLDGDTVFDASSIEDEPLPDDIARDSGLLPDNTSTA